MASLKFILKTQREDKSGKSPLYIRVIQNRKTVLISTGIKLHKMHWDEVHQKVKKQYPNSTRLNAVLAAKLADASIQVLDEERKYKNITASRIKQSLDGKDSVNFFSYADKALSRMRNQISYNTFKNYKFNIKKFCDFIGTDELLLEEMSVSLIKDFIKYLSIVKKNKANTIKTVLIPLSSLYNMAIDEGLTEKSSFPFDKIKLKSPQSKRNYLSKEQLLSLQHYGCISGSKMDLYRNLFLFAVSAGGLRFTDIITLKWGNIDIENGIIERRIHKTGRIHRLKMGSLALMIVERYKPESPQPGNFVFPAISGSEYNRAGVETQSKLMLSSNALCNIYLKKLGENLELPFKLHFHLIRHTFATMALNNGMRIEYVSKLMDHSKISTTQIYAKVMDEELDKAVDQFVI